MAKTDKSGSGKWSRWNDAVKKGFATPGAKRRASTPSYKPVEGVPF